MSKYTTPLILALAALSHASPIAIGEPNPTSWDKQTWDIIVVGAGPAGLVAADAFSAAGKKTLLLEAGGPSYSITGGTQRPGWLNSTGLSRVDVPGLYKSIFADQGDLTCTNYTNAFGGCTVGGSSAVNAGLFFEPPASDFDDYFPDNWKARDVDAAVKRAYKRVEASEVYSEDGKFYLQSGYEAAKKWLVQGAGFKNVNINDEADNKSKVFGRPIFDYVNGQRGGPVVSYLQDSLKRENFHLQTRAFVKRIVRSGDTATGVAVALNNANNTIPVNIAKGGKVILAGGALQSPALLWFSGIGDSALKANLTAAGKLEGVADWIENKAIGDGLFDNPNTFVELEGPTISSYVHNYSDPIPTDAALYVEHRSGPYSFASETSSFWDYVPQADGGRIGCQGTIDSSGFAAYTSNKTITLNVYGTSGMYSRGKVVLNDALLPGPSPETYYSDPRDASAIATFIRGIFDHLDPRVLSPLNIPLNSTQAEILAYITSATDYTRGQVNHWSSSCRIGSCVDDNALVKGTKNIHVVDASILAPLTVNPQFGVVIGAEHASQRILGSEFPKTY